MNGTSVEMMNGLKMSKSDFYETPNIEKLAKEGLNFRMPIQAHRFVLLLGIVFSLVNPQLD